jgi:hypothetical protein
MATPIVPQSDPRNTDNFDYAAFDALPEAERQEILRLVLEAVAALGVTLPDEDAPVPNGTPVVTGADVDDMRQSHCDAVAAELLEEVEI